jgi:Mab-21 protein
MDESGNVSDFMVRTSLALPFKHQWNLKLCEPIFDYAVRTGSAEEIYIRPILPCENDADYTMFHRSAVVLSSYDQNTFCSFCLPTGFEDTVHVYEVHQSLLPGYVYLSSIGVLKKEVNKIHERYEYVRNTPTTLPVFLRRQTVEQIEHGPAWRPQFPFSMTFKIAEFVLGIRCLSWPTQAADWPIRRRQWPDRDVVDSVVKNGCDFVQVAHHSRRQDRWDRIGQFRFSFSRAEVVLLNNWTPIQQIVYHMLRFVTNAEGLTELLDNTGRNIFSRYQIKTMMMWTCEWKQARWWTTFNVVQLSAHLIGSLNRCFTGKCCPGYFIAGVNLFERDFDESDCTDKLQQISSCLERLTDASNLATWFAVNYELECVSRFFTSVELSQFFEPNHFMSEMIRRWQQYYDTSLVLVDYMLSATRWVHFPLQRASNGIAFVSDAIKRLRLTDAAFCEYVIGVCFLSACGASVLIPDNFTLSIIEMCFVSSTPDITETVSDSDCLLLFEKAVSLMKKSTSLPQHGITNRILLTLSYMYFTKTVSCSSGNKTIFNIGNVYMAVLCYVTGQLSDSTRTLHVSDT